MSIVILPRRKERRRTVLVGRENAPSPIVLPGDPGTGTQPPSSSAPPGGAPGVGGPPGLGGRLPPGLGGSPPGRGRGRTRDETGGGGAGGGPPAVEQVGYETIGTLTSFGSSDQVGYEFTVGAANITIVALRGYPFATRTDYRVRLWRVSDEALIADPAVNSSFTANVWNEEPVTPVVLTAGQNYIVTMRGGTSMWRDTNIAGAAFNDAITFVQGRRIGNNNFPTTTIANEPRGLADIVFTIP